MLHCVTACCSVLHCVKVCLCVCLCVRVGGGGGIELEAAYVVLRHTHIHNYTILYTIAQFFLSTHIHIRIYIYNYMRADGRRQVASNLRIAETYLEFYARIFMCMYVCIYIYIHDVACTRTHTSARHQVKNPNKRKKTSTHHSVNTHKYVQWDASICDWIIISTTSAHTDTPKHSQKHPQTRTYLSRKDETTHDL